MNPDPKQKVIICEKRSHDYKAYFEHEPGAWEAGDTPPAALGMLIYVHRNELGLSVEMAERKASA